jgi:hypothetical protein
LEFFSKTNVMIQFLHNLALFWAKKAIFAKFFGENIFKIITSATGANPYDCQLHRQRCKNLQHNKQPCSAL